MKKKYVIIVVLLLVSIMAWWHISYPSGTWRYKMTVTVQTPEGVKTGSTVRQVSAHLSPRVSPHSGGSASVDGEAVVIDLGHRGVVFALLKGPRLGENYGDSLPFYAFPSSHKGLTPQGIAHFSNLKAGPKVLELDLYPQIIRFKDINDPLTVENLILMRRCTEVDQPDWLHHLCLKDDRFAEVFGEGVKIESITIEMTNESVTNGIVNKYLKWLSPLKGGYLHGKRSSRGAPLGLHGGNFQTGDR